MACKRPLEMVKLWWGGGDKTGMEYEWGGNKTKERERMHALIHLTDIFQVPTGAGCQASCWGYSGPRDPCQSRLPQGFPARTCVRAREDQIGSRRSSPGRK